MGRIIIMLIVALFFIDAALMGNIGSILGAIIDPANMNESTISTSTATGAAGSF